MAETIEEVKAKIQMMKSHFKGGFSSIEREYLDALYLRIFGKPLPKRSGCQDCYRDGFIAIGNKLKTMTEMPKESHYRLKAGVVASTFGSSDFYVLDMPDEVAEKWLRDNPSRINLFQKFPENWQERVMKSETPTENAPEQANGRADNEDTMSFAEKPRRGRKSANKAI